MGQKVGQGGTVAAKGQHKGRGKGKPKPPNPVAILEGGDEVRMTDHDVARLRHADALRAAGGTANRKRARAIVVDVEAGMLARADEVRVDAGMDEVRKVELARACREGEVGVILSTDTVHLASIRRVPEPVDGSFDPLAGTLARDEDGQLIVDVEAARPMRIDARDGLRSLFVAKRLREAAYLRGLAFRQLHEAAGAGLRCSLAGGGGSTALGAFFGEAAARLVVGEARQAFLAHAHAVAGDAGVRVLQLVAGEGRSIRSVAASETGSARDREAKRLAKVLDQATPAALACALDAPGGALTGGAESRRLASTAKAAPPA